MKWKGNHAASPPCLALHGIWRLACESLAARLLTLRLHTETRIRLPSHPPSILTSYILYLLFLKIFFTLCFMSSSTTISIEFISSASLPFSHRWRRKGTQGLTANRWWIFVEGGKIKEEGRGVTDKGQWPTPAFGPANMCLDPLLTFHHHLLSRTGHQQA